MNKTINIILVFVLFSLLAAVRYFQGDIFYDPFLPFFKSNFAAAPLPELISPKFYFHITFRFLINSILSLAILWFLFRKWDIIKISTIIYTVFFILLMGAMVLLIDVSGAGNHQLLFYVRRFLIQPLLLLLLIPAFYIFKNNGI